jgi:multiple sugar transport system substrate-binding protein
MNKTAEVVPNHVKQVKMDILGDHPVELTRRDFLRALGLGTLATALVSCNQSAPSQNRSSPVNIVYQDWRTPWFPPMVAEMLKLFHAEHPEIRVFFTPDPVNLVQEMSSDLQSGYAPDVFQGCCTHFPAWAQQGFLLDLNPYVQRDLGDQTLNDWNPAQLSALTTEDGLRFGLPKYHGALALYFNKDIFDEYGVDYPDDSWDYEDYLAAMRLLRKDDNSTGETKHWGSAMDISWDRIQVHINAWGGHIVDPQNARKSRLADKEALAAMEWIRARIWDDRVMPSPLELGSDSITEAFQSGKLAMVEDGSWSLKSILTNANFRMGVAPLPAGPAGRATIATTDGFGIFAGTAHREEAWTLMKFLISEEYGLAMARANLLQPARSSLVDDWIKIVREAFPENSKGLDLEAFAEGTQKGYSVTAEIFSNMPAVKALIEDAWDQIFVLGDEPVALMRSVSAKVDEALG